MAGNIKKVSPKYQKTREGDSNFKYKIFAILFHFLVEQN